MRMGQAWSIIRSLWPWWRAVRRSEKKKSKLSKAQEEEGYDDNIYRKKKFNLPFISAKIAISKDYFTINKKSKWITNKRSQKITHLLRSQNDCIISTSKSINKDNSLLNCRIDGLNNFKPDLFIIDLKLKLKKNLSINTLTNKRKTFLITTNPFYILYQVLVYIIIYSLFSIDILFYLFYIYLKTLRI